MSRRRRVVEEKSGSSSEWLLTFSDVLTLLITFFVLLISMSSMDSKQLKETSAFFRGALGNLEGSKGRSTTQLFTPKRGHPRVNPSQTPVADKSAGSSSEAGDPGELDTLIKQAVAMGRKLIQEHKLSSKGDHPLDAAIVEIFGGARPIEFVRTAKGGYVKLHLGLLFGYREAALQPALRAWLQRLDRTLKGGFDRVEMPARERGDTAQLESPWMLAAWRSAAVAHVLRPGGKGMAAAVIQAKSRSYARIVWSKRATGARSEVRHGR